MFKLGLDIDGCINNFSTLIYEYAAIFNEKYGIDKKPDLSDYLIERYFGWSQYMNNEFWTLYYRQALSTTAPLPGAAQTISLLKRNGVHIYLITARAEKYREITTNWLNQHNIKFDKLIMSKEKAIQCLENKIDLMIEDEPGNCEAIAKQIPVLCMSYKYNEHLSARDNITPVSNWAEIYNEVIHSMKQKKAV
jgi:uncharacterized HAD superfamily protein